MKEGYEFFSDNLIACFEKYRKESTDAIFIEARDRFFWQIFLYSTIINDKIYSAIMMLRRTFEPVA